VLEGWLATIQGLEVAQALRASRWAYPLVNVGHVLGLAALFGAILVLDLRLIGVWRGVDAAAIERPAVTVAAAGLAVAAVTGGLLFSVRASEYAALGVFWVKIGFVAAGTLNAVVMRATGLGRKVPAIAAGLSLIAWTGAIVAGRLIGYWES
jgi:hypothetical protein